MYNEEHVVMARYTFDNGFISKWRIGDRPHQGYFVLDKKNPTGFSGNIATIDIYVNNNYYSLDDGTSVSAQSSIFVNSARLDYPVGSLDSSRLLLEQGNGPGQYSSYGASENYGTSFQCITGPLCWDGAVFNMTSANWKQMVYDFWSSFGNSSSFYGLAESSEFYPSYHEYLQVKLDENGGEYGDDETEYDQNDYSDFETVDDNRGGIDNTENDDGYNYSNDGNDTTNDDNVTDTSPTDYQTQPIISDVPPQSVEGNAEGGAYFEYPSITAYDYEDGDLSDHIECNPASGSFFVVATSVNVVCEVTDSSGLIGATTFTITVVDTVPPELTVPEDITYSVHGQQNSQQVNFEVTAIDLVDPNPDISCITVDGQTINSGDTLPVGTTTVTCVAIDDSGNESDPGTFNIEVLSHDNGNNGKK